MPRETPSSSSAWRAKQWGNMQPRQGARAFLRFDSPSRGRILEPGVVEEIGDDSWRIVFAARHHAVETGEEKQIYYHRAGDFFEQPVRVENQSEAGPPYVLTARPIGEAISANSRREERVNTSDLGLAATVSQESQCPVQDLSLSGLAILSRSAHHIGKGLEIAVIYRGEEIAGEMEVQGVATHDDGRTRYGLLGVFDTAEGRALKNGLTRMTLEIQNQRLQERSGTFT
jgi:hypothetical protein